MLGRRREDVISYAQMTRLIEMVMRIDANVIAIRKEIGDDDDGEEEA